MNKTTDWINTKDKLPEPYVDVLVYGCHKNLYFDEVWRTRIDYLCEASTGEKYWFNSFRVRYWMKIPELPENE